MDANACGLVIDALQQAMNPGNDIQKSAQRQLQIWEMEQGFYTVLMVSKSCIVVERLLLLCKQLIIFV